MSGELAVFKAHAKQISGGGSGHAAIFSGECTAIVPAVKAMAQRFHSELVLLHVVGLPVSVYGAAEAAAWATLINAEQLRENGRLALDHFVKEYLSGMKVAAKLDEGDAARSIVDIAEEERAGLIMMPTRGLGRFRALLLGSVTAKVLHDAQGAVWTGVHAEQCNAHPADQWKNMLCAIDTNPRDMEVLRWAACFAKDQGMTLRLVHAVQGATPLNEESDLTMYDFLFSIARDTVAKMQKDAETRLDVCFLLGKVGPAVKEAALAYKSDIVAIGRGVMQDWLGRL